MIDNSVHVLRYFSFSENTYFNYLPTAQKMIDSFQINPSVSAADNDGSTTILPHHHHHHHHQYRINNRKKKYR